MPDRNWQNLMLAFAVDSRQFNLGEGLAIFAYQWLNLVALLRPAKCDVFAATANCQLAACVNT